MVKPPAHELGDGKASAMSLQWNYKTPTNFSDRPNTGILRSRRRSVRDRFIKRLCHAIGGPIAHMELVGISFADKVLDCDAVLDPALHQLKAAEQVDVSLVRRRR